LKLHSLLGALSCFGHVRGRRGGGREDGGYKEKSIRVEKERVSKMKRKGGGLATVRHGEKGEAGYEVEHKTEDKKLGRRHFRKGNNLGGVSGSHRLSHWEREK